MRQTLKPLQENPTPFAKLFMNFLYELAKYIQRQNPLTQPLAQNKN